jgi:hypothetical protein
MEAPVMGSFKRVFDPLDLETIDRVYEVVWSHVEACQPYRDSATDDERREAVRKRIFVAARIAGPGQVDFDNLTEVVLATMPEQWLQPSRRVSPRS